MESLWVHRWTCNNQSWKDHFKEALYEDSHFLDWGEGMLKTLRFSEVFDIDVGYMSIWKLFPSQKGELDPTQYMLCSLIPAKPLATD